MARHLTMSHGPTQDDLACIPAALKVLPQWVLWRGADRVDEKTGEVKLNKIPMNPQTLTPADTTDPLTWSTLKQCTDALPCALEEWEQEARTAYRGGGIGFVFTSDDPYVGVDLDGCVDPETGTIASWAQAHVEALASYTEVTPSRTGLHVLVEGALPPKGRKKGHIEMYSYARFFTMTGWQVAGTPPTIEDRQGELTALHAAVFGPQETPGEHTHTVTVSLEDTALLAKAQAAKNSAKFTRLWAGDTAMHNDDDSSADMALCCMLAFWTQDPAQLDRLFRQSGLMRDKWDERRGQQTYGARTVQEALARQTKHYHMHGDLARQRNGQGPAAPFACPELPAYAQTNEESAAEASLFLDDYITLSTKWAPRAYSGFHEAVALFLLSTLAARRIKLVFGPRGVYTSLYIALAARTTVYTKSTTADIGLELLDAAGLSWLLADDDSTPPGVPAELKPLHPEQLRGHADRGTGAYPAPTGLYGATWLVL